MACPVKKVCGAGAGAALARDPAAVSAAVRAISREVGLGLGELCRLNGIQDPRRHTLQIGAVLKVAPEKG
jgi:tRNA-dihydrouridine synthase